MCCPLYPFHIVLLYLCLLLPLLLALVQGAEELALSSSRWNLTLKPEAVNKLEEGSAEQMRLSCFDCIVKGRDPAGPDDEYGGLKLVLWTTDDSVATLKFEMEVVRTDQDGRRQQAELDLDDVANPADEGEEGGEGGHDWSLAFNVSAERLGYARIGAKVVRQGRKSDNSSNEEVLEEVLAGADPVPVSVVRKKTIMTKLFAYSVAALISLAYVNLGCALDLGVVRENLRRPVGPVIGLLCQYLLMPLLAFLLGFAYPASSANAIPLRLGLFVTGCSPGGAGSNIWTVLFGGNVDLSVTMTALSTFASFGMLPLWLFSLGQFIVDGSGGVGGGGVDDGGDDVVRIRVPYSKISVYAISLAVPLLAGILVRRFCPQKVSGFFIRILKPMALTLIVYIMTFGIWTNLYIFQIMSWYVLLTGMLLPWVGFAAGYAIARALRRPPKDVIAIAIETGIQNTGVSIFVLWFTFEKPLGDITAVVPVAAATMTPVPLLIAYLIKKIAERYYGYGDKEIVATEVQQEKVEQGGGGIIKKPAKKSGAGEEVKGNESKQLLLNNHPQGLEGQAEEVPEMSNGHAAALSKGDNAAMA